MKNVAIIAGGDSSEYVISVKSAEVVKKRLPSDKYNSFIVHMKKGIWSVKHDEQDFPVDKNDFSITLEGKKINFDCVFFAIHGTPAEDGKLQGYFDILGIPYTTCGAHSASLTFNKNTSKEFLRSYGITSAKAVVVFPNEKVDTAKIIETVGLPCFVKPNNGGSSFGTFKIYKEEELAEAISNAFKEDGEVIIEEFIQGTEITCGVFPNNGELVALPITEIVPKADFFDFKAKYEGLSEEITPARISNELTEECQTLTKKLYKLLGCKGVVRIDYLIKNNTLYFMEANTIPGLSEASIVPQQIREYGWTLSQFFDCLVEETLS